MPRPTPKRRPPAHAETRGGFTMIELMMVLVIIGILLSLLLPAINGALRSARNAAVSSEIAQLAQALANFKSRYGDYPPSRVYLSENGYFPVTSTVAVDGDVTEGALAQRSLTALRKFFPRVVFSSQAIPSQITSTFFYDYNGNGTNDGNYILEGHQCLVFFLGGIPLYDSTSQTYGMTGFSKNPNNPFMSISVSTSRQTPIFEFSSGRLFLDPNDVGNAAFGTVASGIPGYYDSLGGSPPGEGLTLNFYAYFSAYGTGVYDPNDVNFITEADGNGVAPIALAFDYGGTNFTSAAPNPYSTTLTVTTTGATTGTVMFEKPQSFQIISAGGDGLYGVGGQYVPMSTGGSAAVNPLPYDQADTTTTDGANVRIRERDNLTNFQSGPLQQ